MDREPPGSGQHSGAPGGAGAAQQARLARELATLGADHAPPAPEPQPDEFASAVTSPYAFDDLFMLRQAVSPQTSTVSLMKTLDELLERDRRREQDGFPRKIQVGRLVKAKRGAKGQVVVVVPSTEEEKFYHDTGLSPPDEGRPAGGTGEEEEGEILGEQRARPEGDQSGAGPGEGGEEEHDMESTAYELGRTLTEQFQLPNLKEKAKRRSLTRYTYDLTDRNRGSGQILDKKATLRRILQTNLALGTIAAPDAIDTTRLVIAPADRVYRVLSPERDYEPQAVVFFVRDYSGSMAGKVTDLIVTQHVLIYSWLLYQYAGQVETRFVVHDTQAREVPDFNTYYNSRVAGGTQVASAYQLVNELVERDGLARDYNIYVFHGTDGDDWDTYGDRSLPELERMLTYVSRMGITIAEHADLYGETEVSRYLQKSGLLQSKQNLLRMDTIREDADEARLIEGIKKLIS